MPKVLRTAALFVLTVVAVSCNSKCSKSGDNPKVVTPTPLFTVISSREIKAVPGAKIEAVVAKDGSVHEVKIIARDNREQTQECGCSISACQGNCTPGTDGLGATCDGSCLNSERNPCGGCSFSTPSDGGSGSGTRVTQPISSVTPVVKQNP